MVRDGDGARGWGAEAVPMGMGGLCGAFGTPYSSTFAVVWKIPLLPHFVYSISLHLILAVAV